MRPSHLPRLALASGVPIEHRVMVVIPAMLTRRAEILELTHRNVSPSIAWQLEIVAS